MGHPGPSFALFAPENPRGSIISTFLVFVAAHIGGDTRGCYLLVAAVQLQPAMDPAVGHPGLL